MGRNGVAVAPAVVEPLTQSDAVFRVAQIRVLGGAYARVPSEATAYAHRAAPIMANLAAFWTTPEDRVKREAWIADFAGALAQETSGAYVNFLAAEGPDRVRGAYPGATWDRLRRIKAQYDPANLFRLNQNIPPAA